MKRIYIACPISRGDLKHNVDQATAAFLKLAKAGHAPFNPAWSVYAKPAEVFHLAGIETPDLRPHVYCRATTDGAPGMSHAEWLAIDFAWVAVSDAVLRLPGESKGADRETAEAERLGIPVFHSVADLLRWAREVDAVAVS